MDIELRPLSAEDGLDLYDMLQEIPSDENGFINGVKGISVDEFKRWLVSSVEKASGIGLEDWQVPQNVYWLYVNGFPVGMGKLRHRLTERLLQEGGHIGYAIRPSSRGHRYGTMLLGLLIGEARKLHIEKVLVTVKSENIPSLHVALGNGGSIERVENGRHYIWIQCQNNLSKYH